MSQAFDQGTALPCLSFVGTPPCLVGHHQEQVERQLTSPVLAEALRISGVPLREELTCYNRCLSLSLYFAVISSFLVTAIISRLGSV